MFNEQHMGGIKWEVLEAYPLIFPYYHSWDPLPATDTLVYLVSES